MVVLQIQPIVCLIVLCLSCVLTTNPDQNPGIPDLNIPLNEHGREQIPPTTDTDKPNNNIILPTNKNINNLYEVSESIHKKQTTQTEVQNIDGNELNDTTESWDYNFTEATETDSTVDSTTDLWTTTGDYDTYDDAISIPSQAIASLLG